MLFLSVKWVLNIHWIHDKHATFILKELCGHLNTTSANTVARSLDDVLFNCSKPAPDDSHCVAYQIGSSFF